MGVTGALPDDLSLALGTGEVRLIDMASAYAGLLNGGLRVRATGIDRVDSDGHSLPLDRPGPVRVVDAERASQMRAMLAGVVAHGSGKAAAILGRFVAGKTGTTQDYRDAWFIGEAGSTIIGVWLGNDDDKPTRGVTGSGLPAKLFHDVAERLAN